MATFEERAFNEAEKQIDKAHMRAEALLGGGK